MEYQVSHIRLDGTIQESMEGVVLPKELSNQIFVILANSQKVKEMIACSSTG